MSTPLARILSAVAMVPERVRAWARSAGLAKVVWSLSVHPFGAGHTVLVSETRTQAPDDIATRRFALIWPLISPFAALLRSQVLRAIKAQAEQDLP